MPSYNETYFTLVQKIQSEVPGFRVAYKDEATWKKDWKLKLAALLIGIFNKKFMAGFTTTLFPVVYFPSREHVEADYLAAFRTLAHEYVHLYDERRQRFWFPVSYLLPQLLAVFALGALGAIGAIWNPQCLWFLLFLLFLGFAYPWRAKWRSKWEMRGYTMTMAVFAWRYGHVPADVKARVIGIFVGMDYYKMWSDEKAVSEEVERRAKLIETGELYDTEQLTSPYEVAHAIWMSTTTG